MEYFKVIDIIQKPISGEWGDEPEQDDGELVKVIRTTNFTNIGRIDLEKEVVIRRIKHDLVSSKKLLPGDIIIEKSGGSPTQPVGRVVYFDNDDEDYLCNNFTSILRAKEGTNSKYLLYFLLYQHLSKKTLRFQNKTTGIINLQLKNYLESSLIPIPSILTQEKIVEILDKAQELIDKRKEQIEKLDEFIQSIFLDMFGDPIKNPKEWNQKSFANGIQSIKYGVSIPPVFSREGIPFIRATNIKNGRIIENDMKYISLEEAQKIEKCKLEVGDILIVRSGVNTGDSTFVNKKYNNSYGGYDIIVKLNNNLNYAYINGLFNSIYREVFIDPLTRRAGQQHLNIKQIQGLLIMYPPIDLQNYFSDIVEKTEQQKDLLQNSLTELENNFNSLMQRAFKGELFS